MAVWSRQEEHCGMLKKINDPSLPLDDGQHELFAQECALGSNITDAYEKAGYARLPCRAYPAFS
jgi:hypothetical protein